MYTVIEKNDNSKGALITYLSKEAFEEVAEGKSVDETRRGTIYYQFYGDYVKDD